MKNILIFTFLAAVSFSSCKKNGTGGKATIQGQIEHHGSAIPSSTVYIKYNSNEFPGTNVSVYDASIETTGGAGHFKFENMRMGTYYLYGIGYDSSISKPVYGGTPVVITYSERKKTFDIDIPVTEE